MDKIYGVPILIEKMPDHKQIKKSFQEFLENDDYFSPVESWKCNVETTFSKENNFNLPWDFFIENAVDLFYKYLNFFPIDKPFGVKIYAWLNRYKKHHYQEIHNHFSDGSVLSCAYMLELPENTGDFSVYQSGNDFFPSELKTLCSAGFPIDNRFTPVLNEGDIVIFPSYLDHFVTENTSNFRRATISANLYINPLDRTDNEN